MSGDAVKRQQQQPQPIGEQEEEKKYPVKASALFGTISSLGALPILELGLHGGVAGLLIAGCIGYASWRHGPQLYELLQKEVGDLIPLPDLWDTSEEETADPGNEQEQAPARKSSKKHRSWLDRATGYFPPGYFDDDESGEGGQAQRSESGPGEEIPADARFVVPSVEDTNGVARLTIEEIVAHTVANSYQIWIGRSLTKAGNPGVRINIYKQHFRCMGASQRGKSSMAAAFIDIVTRTHDVRHVRLVLLDRENRTSNLFADLPHVLSMKKADGSIAKMHARTNEQVLEYLIHTVAIMQHRYTLPVEQVANLPVILVYIEEFLALKNYFRLKIRQAKTTEQREKAQNDYATLVYCIEELAQVGLKVRVQLLLCAQVEYADDDFKEALASVQCGFAFCIRPTAAASAGFMQNELIRKNAKEDKPGQAVVETPDCKDLVLAPHYPLESLLIACQKAYPQRFTASTDSPDAPGFEREILPQQSVNVNRVNRGEALEKRVNMVVNQGESSPEAGNVPPRFTEADEVKVLLAYYELTLEMHEKEITRTKLRDKLGWNSKQYSSILKPICDKHGILMEKEGA